MHKPSKSDPLNGNKDDMIYYFNILMDNQATLYSRKHYTVLDLLKEQGGLIKGFFLIAFILMKPFTFKTHALQVFKGHMLKKSEK